MLTNRKIALLVILFVGMLAWRSPQLLVAPRFWGEEGRYYYAALQASRWSVFSLVVRGNFQLITNLGAVIATLVPALWAPAVTTYFGYALAAACIYLFGVFARESGWTFFTALLASAALALFAQGYEVYLSTVNAQWLCAVSLLFLASLSLRDLSAQKKLALYGWVSVCALSGVPPVVLTPIFFLAARIRKSKDHLVCAAILLAGAGVQIIVILMHSHSERGFHPDAALLTAPWLLQTVASPLLTAGYTDALISHLRSANSVALYAATFGILLFVAVWTMASAFIGSERKSVAAILVLTWIWVPTVQIFGSLGDNPGALLSGWLGGRYYFLGVFCFILLLASIANSSNRSTRAIAIVALGWMCAAGIFQARYEDWQAFTFSGPSWRSAIATCADVRPCTVQAWPGGTDWTFQLYRQ